MKKLFLVFAFFFSFQVFSQTVDSVKVYSITFFANYKNTFNVENILKTVIPIKLKIKQSVKVYTKYKLLESEIFSKPLDKNHRIDIRVVCVIYLEKNEIVTIGFCSDNSMIINSDVYKKNIELLLFISKFLDREAKKDIQRYYK